jgi:hypothetical protein
MKKIKCIFAGIIRGIASLNWKELRPTKKDIPFFTWTIGICIVIDVLLFIFFWEILDFLLF